MKHCNCHPRVSNPTHRGWISTAGIGVYSPGTSYNDALYRVKAHAKIDGIPKSSWIDVFVECLACGAEVSSDAHTCKVGSL